jgi:hypothetical protein
MTRDEVVAGLRNFVLFGPPLKDDEDKLFAAALALLEPAPQPEEAHKLCHRDGCSFAGGAGRRERGAVSEQCEGCGSNRIAGHTIDDVALCPRCAPVQDGERVAEYERLRDAAYHAVEEAWLLKSEASQDHALRTSAALDALVLPLLAAPKQDASDTARMDWLIRRSAVVGWRFPVVMDLRAYIDQQIATESVAYAAKRDALATEGGSDA